MRIVAVGSAQSTLKAERMRVLRSALPGENFRSPHRGRGWEEAETGERGGRDWGASEQSPQRLFHAESTESRGNVPTRQPQRLRGGGCRATRGMDREEVRDTRTSSRSMCRPGGPTHTAGQGTLALCELSVKFPLCALRPPACGCSSSSASRAQQDARLTLDARAPGSSFPSQS